MSRMSELHADLLQDDGNAELHFALCEALLRVGAGTTTMDDARLLCYALNIDIEEIGLQPVRERRDAFDLIGTAQ